MGAKLKTKLTFEFDIEGLEEEVPQLNYEVKMETKSPKKSINIIQAKKKKKILDASTKLF